MSNNWFLQDNWQFNAQKEEKFKIFKNILKKPQFMLWLFSYIKVLRNFLFFACFVFYKPNKRLRMRLDLIF